MACLVESIIIAVYWQRLRFRSFLGSLDDDRLTDFDGFINCLHESYGTVEFQELLDSGLLEEIALRFEQIRNSVGLVSTLVTQSKLTRSK